MKILLGGDTHGNLHFAWYLVDTAVKNGCDRVFQLGDFGYWEHEKAGVTYLDKLENRARKSKTTFYFLDGNHDKTSLLVDIYRELDDEGFIVVRDNIRYSPRGHRWTWNGKRFISLGGAYSTDKAWRLALEKKKAKSITESNTYRPKSRQLPIDTAGTIWFPEEEMSDEDMDKILADTTPVDVILAHDKPRAANPNCNRKDISECWTNQDRLQRAVLTLLPSEFYHGHLHYRYENNILIGDDKYTKVIGLDSDPESAYSRTKSDAYLVLDW